MERVSFIVEETGERIACLLNPESVTLRRQAGLRRRRLGGRSVTRRDSGHDALLFTGGGRTELRLDLLFDVAVAGSTVETENVRDLTRPLWELAESTGRGSARGAQGPGRGRPRRVRLVWGKTWNVPAVVAEVAERVELFSRTGVPRRSWLRMRLLRVPDRDGGRDAPEAPRPPLQVAESPEVDESGEARIHTALGGGPGTGAGRTERLENIAQEHYGNPAFWRVIAAYNDVDDPLRMPGGRQLEIPPPSVVENS